MALFQNYIIFLCCFSLNLKSVYNEGYGDNDRAQTPNFLLFIVDDLGYSDIGCFGNKTLRTPNVDSLCTTGTKMTHVLAASVFCTPSRAALLTGRYPIRTGMAPSDFPVYLFVGSRGGLPAGTVTFPKLLQNAGYVTGLVGKWHLGFSCNWKSDLCHHPNKQGFDYFYGLPLTNFLLLGDNDINLVTVLYANTIRVLITIMIAGIITAVFSWRWKYRKLVLLILLPSVMIPGIFLLAVYRAKILNSLIMRNGEVVEQPIRLWTLTRRFVHESKNFIETQHSNNKPFLLILSFTHVHTPLTVHPSMVGRSRHGLYGDAVEEVDWAVGELLHTLDRFGIRNNTMVMFTSDQGALSNEKGPNDEIHGGSNGVFSGGKGMFGMEGGLRVPTIFSWPGVIPQGRTVKAPASLMDVFPTILSLANVSYPSVEDLDGKDMSPLIKEQTTVSRHKFILHYGMSEDIHAVTYVENATAVWKVHYIHPKWLPGTRECKTFCKPELEELVFLEEALVYNIISDPGEWNPLSIDDSKRKEILDVVQMAMMNHSSSVKPVPSQLSLSNNIWLPWLQPCCNFPYCYCEEAIDEILK